MPTTIHRVPAVTATQRAASAIDTDLLLIPVFEDDPLSDVGELGEGATELESARTRKEFTAKPFEVLFVRPTGWKAGRVALVGGGKRGEYGTDGYRRLGIAASTAARQRRLARVAILARADGGPSERIAQAVTEGLVIGNFEIGFHKTGEPSPAFIESAEIAIAGDTKAAIARGLVLGECTNLAREFANEPGNALTPTAFADRAAAFASAAGLTVETFDEKQIAALGMGLLLGVARGSAEPPRMLVMRHEPKNASGPVLGLIGKGITFDTGGISIKPAENMDKMKDDMAGGAAVVGAMAAIARLNAPVRVIGVVPMTENMPGGRAVKPGDVLTSACGKTVEILNTDAEGRLVLGDAIWYARQQGATHLVDVATLTGACVVALGRTTSGLFGTPTAWVEQVKRASERAGDRSWPMPVFDDYKEQLKSDIADFTNTGGRAGGAITAALFIKEFVDDLPWVHIDIAGTAWADDAKLYQQKGATGVCVRTLAELALDAESWVNLKG